MADKKIYSLFDKTINAFLNPLVFTNDGEAVRWFTTIVNQQSKDNSVYLHYSDYSLHILGTLDDKSGDFNGPSRKIIEGTAVKEETVQYTLDDLFSKLEQRNN